jgi:hypothetical protein
MLFFERRGVWSSSFACLAFASETITPGPHRLLFARKRRLSLSVLSLANSSVVFAGRIPKPKRTLPGDFITRYVGYFELAGLMQSPFENGFTRCLAPNHTVPGTKSNGRWY